jgi:hypothetical protein
VVLVGGPADGREAPALPRVHVPLLGDEYVVDYDVQKIALPFDPGRPDAIEHPPEAWRYLDEHPTYWTFRVWLHPDRFREVDEQIVRTNRAAERAGGYLLLQKRPGLATYHERAAFEFERDRLLAMLEPGWTDTKEADMTVWKFLIPSPDANGVARVAMPASARPLSVAIQNDNMVVWALFAMTTDVLSTFEERWFVVMNTGTDVPLPPSARFLGTVVHPSTGIVWHVFDDGRGARA